jgi:hypothetical protein
VRDVALLFFVVPLFDFDRGFDVPFASLAFFPAEADPGFSFAAGAEP